MKISPAQSDFLNWSRWVAAWLVVAEHARSLIFVDYGELHAPGILAKGFYFLTGFGHEAVMVFFVISGYLVGGKVWSLYREGRFEWRRYLADRLSRLYAVLIVALLLGAALDWTGYLFFNKYGLYNQGYEGSIAVLGAAPIERMGWRDFLVNAFFLQTIVGPTFGSNGPLWSLAYEWWYYVLFPLVLAAVWPIVDGGWRFFKGDRRTKIGDRGEEEILTTEDTTERLGGREMEQPKVGPKGEGVGTTESKRTEDGTGPCLDKPSGAAFSNPSTSELARDSENTSLTRSLSGPVLPATSYSLPVTAPEVPLLDARRSTLDLSRRQRFMIFAGSFLAVAGLCWFLTWHILILFGVWLLGVVAAVFGPKVFRFQPSVFRWTFLLMATGISFGSLLLARVEVLKWGALDQFLIGIGFSLLLAALAPMAWRFPLQGWAHCFSDFSYSVYLIHFPVIMFTLSVGFQLFGNGTRMPFGLLALGWYAGIFSLAIFMSWLVSLFTEKKTASLRKLLYGLLSVRES